MCRPLFPPISQPPEAEGTTVAVRSACSLFSLCFVTCPDASRQMLSPLPALITRPFIFATRDSWVLCTIRALSALRRTETEVTRLLPGLKDHNSQAGAGCLHPFHEQALQRPQVERREPPGAPRIHVVYGGRCPTKTLQKQMYLC